MFQRLVTIFAPALILAGAILVLYAILLALGVNSVSTAFLIVFPLGSGAVIMKYRPEGRMRGFARSLLWLIGVMVLATLGAFISGLEGLICITMAAVPIFLGALVGGLIYILVLRWRAESKGALKIAVLPVILLGLLALPPSKPTTHTIRNDIVIDAPAALVFSMIKSIPDIAPQEVETRLTHLLGARKPTAAIWEERPQGARRHSHWGDEIHFIENITQIEPDTRIAWDFEFPEGWIADGIEDPHVKVGGRYFNVLSGEYRLTEANGQTRLTLTTTTYDASGLGAYAEFWHRYFFTDFHEVILNVVKQRTEAKARLVTANLIAAD